MRLQEEVSVLKQVREMLNRELEETGGGCSVEMLSVSQLRVQLTQKEQDLDRAKEALQGKFRLENECYVTFHPTVTVSLV